MYMQQESALTKRIHMLKETVLMLCLIVGASLSAKENGMQREQREQRVPPSIDKVFGMMDANGDGCLSFEEFKAGREKMMEKHGRNTGERPEVKGQGRKGK